MKERGSLWRRQGNITNQCCTRIFLFPNACFHFIAANWNSWNIPFRTNFVSLANLQAAVCPWVLVFAWVCQKFAYHCGSGMERSSPCVHLLFCSKGRDMAPWIFNCFTFLSKKAWEYHAIAPNLKGTAPRAKSVYARR